MSDDNLLTFFSKAKKVKLIAIGVDGVLTDAGMSLLFFIPFGYFALGIAVKADYIIASILIFCAGYFIFRK
jgi:uncharacterized protein (DUF486 family)